MSSLYRTARFATSAHRIGQCPADARVEVAFAGRSNAGKSSALNRLTGSRKLARTSKTPGRTQLINYFALSGGDGGRYLVDLPGYGYAKVSHSQQRHWQGELGRYLIERPSLRCLVVVMDCRRPLSAHDWRLIEWQSQGAADLHCLLSKADKLSNSRAAQALLGAQRALEAAGVTATLQLFSALKGRGVEDLAGLLDSYYRADGD